MIQNALDVAVKPSSIRLPIPLALLVCSSGFCKKLCIVNNHGTRTRYVCVV
jgi:hypothetical protein